MALSAGLLLASLRDGEATSSNLATSLTGLLAPDASLDLSRSPIQFLRYASAELATLSAGERIGLLKALTDTIRDGPWRDEAHQRSSA